MSNNFLSILQKEVSTQYEGYTNFPTSSVALLINNSKDDVCNLNSVLDDLLTHNSLEDALQDYRQYLEEFVTSEYLDSTLEGTPAYEWAVYTLGLVNWKEVAQEHVDNFLENKTNG
jgi:hypothetical protein